MPTLTDNLIAFDPNDQPGCWSYHDGSKWYVFTKLQGALSSMTTRRRRSGTDIRLFENIDGEWVERVRRIRAEKNETCDLCGASTRGLDAWSRNIDLGVWVFLRRNDKLVKPLVNRFVCRACERRL